MPKSTAKPSLADAIAAHVTTRGPRCTIALLLPGLAVDERRDLEAAFANTALPATAISKGLDAVGHKVSPSSIQRHRRHECTC